MLPGDTRDSSSAASWQRAPAIQAGGGTGLGLKERHAAGFKAERAAQSRSRRLEAPNSCSARRAIAETGSLPSGARGDKRHKRKRLDTVPGLATPRFRIACRGVPATHGNAGPPRACAGRCIDADGARRGGSRHDGSRRSRSKGVAWCASKISTN
jgi:hypothetical protein